MTATWVFGESDIFLDYVHDVAQVGDLLTREEEIALGQQIDAGDSTARDELVARNLRLVISIAKRHLHNCGPLDLSDLCQAGSIGLLHAVEKWDWRRGFKFSTYATWWIRQAVLRAIQNDSRGIRLPNHLWERIHQLWRYERAYLTQHGALPSPAEIAAFAGWELSEVRMLLGLFDSSSMIRLDLPLHVGDQLDGSPQLLEDVLADMAAPNPELRAIAEDTTILDEALGQLTLREAAVVRLRLGLNGEETSTLDQCGELFGISRERVRQIERNAYKKLRPWAEAIRREWAA